MEAIQFDPRSKTMKIIQAPIPKANNPNDVVVHVAYSGVCGTDIHISEGDFPCKEVPFIMGHEFSGVVTSVGSAVENVRPGDKVAVDPNRGCLKCTPCSRGNYHFCTAGSLNENIGQYSNGGWAEYCCVPANQIYLIPQQIPLTLGALAEPLSCISHGWDRLGAVSYDADILIIGAGIIGNLWAALFHLHGYKHVTISELKANRRELTKNLGTNYKIVSPDELRRTNIQVDVIVDCTGCGPAVAEAVEWLKPGGRLMVFGVASPQTSVPFKLYDIYKKELTILGVCINPHSFSNAIGLLECMGPRYLNYETIGAKTYALKDHKEALSTLRKGEISKAVFKVNPTE